MIHKLAFISFSSLAHIFINISYYFQFLDVEAELQCYKRHPLESQIISVEFLSYIQSP